METPRVISRDKASQSGNHGELIVKADLSFCIPFFLLEKKKKRRKNRKNIENYDTRSSILRVIIREKGGKKKRKNSDREMLKESRCRKSEDWISREKESDGSLYSEDNLVFINIYVHRSFPFWSGTYVRVMETFTCCTPTSFARWRTISSLMAGNSSNFFPNFLFLTFVVLSIYTYIYI